MHRHRRLQRRELEAQPGIEPAQQNQHPARPAVHGREGALPLRLLELPVLQDAQRRLDEQQQARRQQADDDVGAHGGEVEQVVAGDVDAEAHGADHHHRAEELDGRVDARDDAADEAVEGEMERDGAEGEEDDEDDRHDAGVRVALAQEDCVGVGQGALLESG